MRQFIRTTMHPAMYHGHNRRPPFFEGWYYKLISAGGTERYAIIPGIILGSDGHAFVQVLNGATGQSAYHRYPIEDFWASTKEFNITIGPNRFRRDQIHLDIDRTDGQVSGELRFHNLTRWPVTLLSPGIMGWYAWVPAMECYHGVVSLNHTISGSLHLDGKLVDFDQGLGYIEKDWGQSFPSAWVWFQTNHFSGENTCITASVAIIPWIGQAFPGFIIGFWHNNLLYRFATYTGAKTEELAVTDQSVDWTVGDGTHRLQMKAARAQGGLILGPTRVEMGKRVHETLNATVDVRLSTQDGQVLFSGQGRHAGLEVHGDLEKLLQLSGGSNPSHALP